MEIERKFVITDRPDLEPAKTYEIEQGYLALATDDGGAEVRLRRWDDGQALTIKGGTGKVRAEHEIELDRERFDAIWPLTEGRRVVKTRRVIPHGELEIELDVYAGELEGLLVAEVEFDTEDAADRFEPPQWFGPEVTGDERYLNERLATSGRPSSD
jgi:adenylate cyclase